MLPVYCNHFGLAREPFSVTPDPNFLYLSASHKEALAQLVYGIRTRRGFVVLTGEVGTGKTTIIQSLLEEIDDGHTRCAFLFDWFGSSKELLRALCREFSLTSPMEREKDVSDYVELVQRFLLQVYKNGDNAVLIIDEAQNLPGEALERVRLLSNFESKQDKLLQIVLVGQPELSARLDQSDLRQLKQRIALWHHLRPLSASECRDYIVKRLEFSGGSAALFADAAMEQVFAFSGGIPRLVNILCDNGLLATYASRKPSVEPDMIRDVARDLHLTAVPAPEINGAEPVVVTPSETSLRGAKKQVFKLTEEVVDERELHLENSQPLAFEAASAEPARADAEFRIGTAGILQPASHNGSVVKSHAPTEDPPSQPMGSKAGAFMKLWTRWRRLSS